MPFHRFNYSQNATMVRLMGHVSRLNIDLFCKNDNSLFNIYLDIVINISYQSVTIYHLFLICLYFFFRFICNDLCTIFILIIWKWKHYIIHRYLYHDDNIKYPKWKGFGPTLLNLYIFYAFSIFAAQHNLTNYVNVSIILSI